MNENTIAQSLQSLIEQTYLIEQEYKRLQGSYDALSGLVKRIIDVLPNAIWVLNSDGTLFLQNSNAKALGEMLPFLLGDKPKEVEHRGAFYLVEFAFSGDKKIVSATDITTQKRTERLASMGQVAAHLAHEIRNPIGSLSLLIGSLSKRALPSQSELIGYMQSAVWRVERIIKATLLFTKGVRINAAPFSFASLCKRCLESLRFYESSKEIAFELDFGDGEYVGDESLLEMVFLNLLTNAIDAIEESESDSGLVRLWREENEDEICFYIYDSGVGIDDKAIIFEPFKTSKQKGNGLGLSLCLEIISAHKGSIEISLNPKTFCVSLPKKHAG